MPAAVATPGRNVDSHNVTVGIVGTGRMGSAMAARLEQSGFDLVVWNRTASKAGDLAADLGVRVAAHPGEVAETAEVVVCSLADDAAVRAAYGGADGLVSGVGAGTVILEMSTVDPSTVVEVGRQVDAAGGALLDAPVSGSVQTATAGSLMIMVGGDEVAYRRATPVLDALASQVVHLGGQGSGATMKLAVNALVYGINGALAEALVLAERAGVDRAAAYDVFARGVGGAPYVGYKRASFVDPDATPVASTLDIVAKDLELISRLSARAGAPIPQTEATRAIVDRAIAAGLSGRDLSAVAEFLRDL
jgi:3-hydroxyisobutyrate dehydrogenase-like beta-hydroxyacid dehydrogenase